MKNYKGGDEQQILYKNFVNPTINIIHKRNNKEIILNKSKNKTTINLILEDEKKMKQKEEEKRNNSNIKKAFQLIINNKNLSTSNKIEMFQDYEKKYSRNESIIKLIKGRINLLKLRLEEEEKIKQKEEEYEEEEEEETNNSNNNIKKQIDNEISKIVLNRSLQRFGIQTPIFKYIF